MMTGPKYSSLEEYYHDIIRTTVDECTLCGDCLRNCPTFPMSEIKDKDPAEIMEKMINFLKDGVFSEEVYVKAFGCAFCGSCSKSCPEEIDVLAAFEAAKIKLVKQGKMPEAVNFVEEIPGLWKTLSALQTKPSEERWLRKVPPRPEKTENVVFLGCTFIAFPHIVFPFLDVLERMGINFVALAGGELCCGFPAGSAAGKVKKSEEQARELVACVKAFSPKRVILPCAGCYRSFTEIYPKFLELDFEVQYYTQFLSENLKEINFTIPLEKTAVLHDSCMSRCAEVNQSVRKFAENIPGFKIIKGKDVCCGGTPRLTFPEMAQKMAPIFIETLAEETIKTGADYLVNICQLCGMTFYPSTGEYSFALKSIPALINESMEGREYENKLESYWKCKSTEEIIEKTRENFEENGFTEEEVRKMLPLFFSFPA